MDLEYMAWRRFAKALPVVAALLVLHVTPVRECVTEMRVEQAMDVLAWVSALIDTYLTPPLIDAGTIDSVPRTP